MKYFEVLVSIKTETEGYKGALKIKNVKDTLFMDKESLEEWKNDLTDIYNNFHLKNKEVC